MGIQIHKAIGYGFKDVKRKSGRIADSRFNLNAVNTDVLYGRLEKFENFIRDRDKCLVLLKSIGLIDDTKTASFEVKWTKAAENVRYSHCLVDNSNVLMFIPPQETDQWYRFDNIIDYTENCGNDMRDECIDLASKGLSGIYPYDGYICKPWMKSRSQEKWMGKRDYELYRDHAIDLTLREHFKNDWCLNIPIAIRLLTAYLGIFKDPKTVMELRPLLYTFWR